MPCVYPCATVLKSQLLYVGLKQTNILYGWGMEEDLELACTTGYSNIAQNVSNWKTHADNN